MPWWLKDSTGGGIFQGALAAGGILIALNAAAAMGILPPDVAADLSDIQSSWIDAAIDFMR